MVKFCLLVDAGSESAILVNADAVRVIREGFDEAGTSRLQFDDTHGVTVRGGIKEVWKKLSESQM